MTKGADVENGRTHEPNLRELTAEIDGMRTLYDERSKWYDARDKDRQTAVDKALAAVEKQTAAAFDASKEANTAALTAQKEAVVKAEDAQRAYNTAHNELARKMDEQNKATMPRLEIENRFKNLEEKLAILTGSFSQGSGAAQGAKSVKEEGRANIAMIIAIISVLLALASRFIK